MAKPIILPSVLKHLPEVQGGLFRVDKDGKVYRRKEDGYVLAAQSKNSRGGRYLSVTAMIDGVQRTFYVHRLVGEAYIPNPEDKPEINHKDGNGYNNHVSNLEWATRQENTIHASQNGMLYTLETRGVPCIFCGQLTLDKDRICADCVAQKKRGLIQSLAQEQRRTMVDIALKRNTPMRDRNILERYARCETYSDIAAIHGITRQRVQQIIAKHLN